MEESRNSVARFQCQGWWEQRVYGRQSMSSLQIEFKDKVVTILESLTMAQLSAPGARDSLKLRIAAAAGTIIGAKVPVKVFLPQFVIQ